MKIQGDPVPACEVYDYNAPILVRPSKAQIEAARAKAGLTQQVAAELVHRKDGSRWREWSGGKCAIDLAVWELFLIKSGLRTETARGPRSPDAGK